MIEASAIDWTQVLVALIAGTPAILATVLAFLIRRAIQTPSGNRIGAIVETTHDLSAVDVALTKAVHEKVTNGDPPPQLPRPLGAHTRKDDK